MVGWRTWGLTNNCLFRRRQLNNGRYACSNGCSDDEIKIFKRIPWPYWKNPCRRGRSHDGVNTRLGHWNVGRWYYWLTNCFTSGIWRTLTCNPFLPVLDSERCTTNGKWFCSFFRAVTRTHPRQRTSGVKCDWFANLSSLTIITRDYSSRSHRPSWHRYLSLSRWSFCSGGRITRYLTKRAK